MFIGKGRRTYERVIIVTVWCKRGAEDIVDR